MHALFKNNSHYVLYPARLGENLFPTLAEADYDLKYLLKFRSAGQIV